MTQENLLSNDWLASIDVLSTGDGGAIERTVEKTQFQDHHEIRVRGRACVKKNLKVENSQ